MPTLLSKTAINRRDFLRTGSATALTAAALMAPASAPAALTDAAGAEWRNKQSGMAYRRLGRTNFMISEVVSGGDPVRPDNYRQIELAIDMGLNYLDMASSYGRGECERAYANIVAGSAKREKVFMATKISNFNGVRNRLYRDIYNGLPTGKQEVIAKRALAMRAERGGEKPGYFLRYFNNQQRQFESTYLSNAMMRDYRHRVDGSRGFRKFIIETLEGSLQRAGVDYFDIVHCPHGAASAEEVQIPEIFETFNELKKQGKVRFLGVSSHNDPAGVLRAAADTGWYDVVMLAYNIINGGYVEDAIRHAASKDVGIIAMKSAMAVATHHKALQPVPEWRIAKVNRIVPGDLKPPLKAYIWSLQNPHIAAVNSNLWDDTFVRENLSVAGKKVELQPG